MTKSYIDRFKKVLFMYADDIISFLNKTISITSLINSSAISSPKFMLPEKILFIMPEFIGDVILLIPLLRNLKYNVPPACPIDVLCSENVSNMIELIPHFNNIFHKKIFDKDKVSFLKNNKYDTVFLYNFPFLWAKASYDAGIKQRIGFSLDKMGLSNIFLWKKLLTHQIPSSSVKDTKHQLNIYLDTLKSLSLKVFDEHFEVKLSDNDFQKAKELIKDIKGLKFLININAGSPGKAWSIKNWVKVINHLKNNFDCTIIATGTHLERKIYDKLSAKANVEIENFCGQTSIRETIALYSYLDLVITVDTAPAHFAGVANTKNIIVIYGPTNHLQWAPKSKKSNIHQVYLDLPCRPCITRICSHRNCINKLTSDMVINCINNINWEQ